MDAESAARHTTATGVMHPGTTLTDAIRLWPTPTAALTNDGETPASWHARQQRELMKGHNGNGMGIPLTMAAKIWPTPTAGTGGPNSNRDERERTGGANLKEQVNLWATPQAHDEKAGMAERVGRHGTKAGTRNLNDEAMLWQTPATDSFRSRGGERKDEMGLDQQARAIVWPTPAARDYRSPNDLPFVERDGGNKGEQLPNFVRHYWPTPVTADDGDKVTATSHQRNLISESIHFLSSRQDQANATAGTPSSPELPSSRPRSQTRKLNPFFVEWLMGWPCGFTLAATGYVLPGTALCLYRQRMRFALCSLLLRTSAEGTT